MDMSFWERDANILVPACVSADAFVLILVIVNNTDVIPSSLVSILFLGPAAGVCLDLGLK